MKIFLIIIVLLIFGYAWSNKGAKKKPKKSTQEELNVIDIDANYLYTTDNYLIGYLQISGRKTDLLSLKEQESLTQQMTAEISTCACEWQILGLSRPEDNSALIYQYQGLLDSASNPVRKKLLRNAIHFQNNLMLSGENVERQFYIKLWEPNRDGAEKDLMEKLLQFEKCFAGNGYAVEILHRTDIIQLNNLINNPSALIYENDMDTGVLTSLEGYHEV